MSAVVVSLLVAQPMPSARWVVVVGHDVGDPGDERLAFAERDAVQVRDVLQELGGATPARTVSLLAPTPSKVRAALGALRSRLEAEAGPADELVLYVSGHADEGELHLGGERLPLRELTTWLDDAKVAVGVLILDACRSGAVTRLKGLKADPSVVLRAEAGAVRGRVVLSASGPDEAAQESATLQGSFFTHHWVVGLRGAADVDRDGAVTLREAYGYAYQRTRQSTFGTRGGVQRPSFHLELEGQGELVLSRLERASSTVVLDVPEAERWQLSRSGSVVALLEREASGLVLAVPAGVYQVQARTAAEVLTARVALAAGQRVVVSRASMTAEPLSVATAKGASTSIGLSASATAASSVVAGVPWLAGVEAKVSANEVVTLGPVNVLGLGFGWRGGRGDAVAFGQHELELRAALGHQFDWGRWMVVPAVEVGGWLALQRGTPGGDRTSLGAVGLASVEGRWRPWRALAVSVGVAGGGVLVNKSGPAVVPRVSGSVGVVGFFE